MSETGKKWERREGGRHGSRLPRVTNGHEILILALQRRRLLMGFGEEEGRREEREMMVVADTLTRTTTSKRAISHVGYA